MSVGVFITIDTEEDTMGRYSPMDSPVDNIACIPRLQAIFDRYGALPTYLVDWPVVNDDNACTVLREIQERGGCEIGTHCHPWNTPPFEEETNEQNSMLCNLPSELVSKKVKTLHEAIVDRFELTPVSFRAGRWGLGSGVARSIRELGYKIDTSVTPFVDWTRMGGPNFSEASTFAYRFDPEDCLHKKEDGCLLEVPTTIGFFQKNFKRCYSVRKRLLEGAVSRYHLVGILDRLGMLNYRWLSPETSSGLEMIRLSKSFIRSGHSFLNMFFHSTTLLPGKTPYVNSERRLERFFKDIEIFLDYAVKKDFAFLPLSKALEKVT